MDFVLALQFLIVLIVQVRQNVINASGKKNSKLQLFLINAVNNN